MPVLSRTKTEKPDPNIVYENGVGHASDYGTFKVGARVQGDNPAVAATFAFWHPVGTPDAEKVNAFDFVVDETERIENEHRAQEEAAFNAIAQTNRMKLEVADVVTCKRDYTTTVDGRPATVVKGSRALVDNIIVTGSREHWS